MCLEKNQKMLKYTKNVRKQSENVRTIQKCVRIYIQRGSSQCASPRDVRVGTLLDPVADLEHRRARQKLGDDGAEVRKWYKY